MEKTVDRGTFQFWSCDGLVLSGRTASSSASHCEFWFAVWKSNVQLDLTWQACESTWWAGVLQPWNFHFMQSGDFHISDDLTLICPPALLEQESSTVSPETCTLIPPTSTSATFSEWWPEYSPASSSACLSITLVGVVCFCSLPSSLDCHHCCCWPSLNVCYTDLCHFFVVLIGSDNWSIAGYQSECGDFLALAHR